MKSYMSCFRKNEKTTGKIVISTLAGIAAGYTVGILTAPRPGKEIRQDISHRTTDTLRRVGKSLADSKERVLGSVKEEAKEAVAELD